MKKSITRLASIATLTAVALLAQGPRPENESISDAATDPAKTGRLDHIAFACEGLKDMKANLAQHHIKFDERVLPRLNMTQLFYYDPDGIAVECNFPAAETPAS